MKKAAVIGSISTDFVVTTSIIPSQGETVIGETFQTFFGGKGANQAVALSRAGAKVYMVGAVGDDAFGERLIKNLADNQVDTKMVTKVSGQESGSAHIQIENGDNRIIVVPGTNDSITVAMIQQHEETLRDMDLVILQNEIPIETIRYVIEFCFKNQLKMIYNPAPAKEIEQSYLEKVTYFTPNEHELRLMFKNQSMETVLKTYPNQLIVTLGDKGVIFFDGQQEQRIPAQKVSNVVDTTGAGDTFNGYFARGILDGDSLIDSLKLGNAASAIAIQQKGAQDGIPFYEKVVEQQ